VSEIETGHENGTKQTETDEEELLKPFH
jgi:hypothetical protein